MHNITKFYTVWFSVYPNIISKLPTICTFKSFVKENNDLKKACRYVHDLLLHLSKCNSSWVVSIKQNMNFNF
jgi:hypothetical protein